MANYWVAKTDNPFYMIHISCPGHNFELLADMPEQLAIAVTSEWESRLPSSVSQLFSGVTLGGISQLTNLMGVDSVHQSLTFQMWTGTSPIEIPLTILFDAERNSLEEVFEPIALLQSLILPVGGGFGFLHPPGPRAGFSKYVPGFESNGYGINVRIGRMMLFKDCILVSANATYDARLDDRGNPISGQIELVIRTAIVYGRTDWLNAMSGRAIG